MCNEDFRLKGDMQAHVKLCKREERAHYLSYRHDPKHHAIINQWLWPRPVSDVAIARSTAPGVKVQSGPIEKPLAGTTTMPNGSPATLCVQLGGPDGAFALIKRPLAQPPNSQQSSRNNTLMLGRGNMVSDKHMYSACVLCPIFLYHLCPINPQVSTNF
jgi:hypothetical protein